MSISRRQFILGTGAGLVLPSYFDKVFTFFENHGEPLLETPKYAERDLFAIDLGSGDFQFNLGSTAMDPPPMTVRQYAVRYFGSVEAYLDDYCEEDARKMDLDAPVDPYYLDLQWERFESPAAHAYRLLEGLDLGPDLTGDDAVGQIIFIDGPKPGSNYLGAQTDYPVTISLLQKRLNELDTGIRIVLA